MPTQIPLVVDFDGTYIRTDSLQELLVRSMLHPAIFFRAIFTLMRNGKAAFKAYLTVSIQVNEELFPVHSEVANFLELQHEKGRSIYLVSGANQEILNRALSNSQIFTEIIGSDSSNSLTGANKQKLLSEKFGDFGFDYIGNSRADVPVWKLSRHCYLAVNGKERNHLSKSISREITIEKIFFDNEKSTLRTWMKQLRVHQALKNLLLFLPLLAAHQLTDLMALYKVILGFVLFSLVAFSVYLINDIIDLESDRIHPRKRNRPLAAGLILPIPAISASIVFLVLGIIGAFLLNVGFGVVILCYLLLTLLYTFWIKKVVLLDVIFLGILYLIRIVAGAVLTQIHLTFWFTAIAFFLFISLGIAKRFSEIASQSSAKLSEKIPGRGYIPQDFAVSLSLGISTGIAAVLLFTIYIQTGSVKLLYPSNDLLWFAIPGILFWVANLWLAAGRNELSDDPVIFAIKNKQSIFSASFIFAIFVLASHPIPGQLLKVISP